MRTGGPITPDDMALAREMARDTTQRLPFAYVQGIAFGTMIAIGLWSAYPWSAGEVPFLVMAAVSVGTYLAGIAYGIRVRRWLSRNR